MPTQYPSSRFGARSRGLWPRSARRPLFRTFPCEGLLVRSRVLLGLAGARASGGARNALFPIKKFSKKQRACLGAYRPRAPCAYVIPSCAVHTTPFPCVCVCACVCFAWVCPSRRLLPLSLTTNAVERSEELLVFEDSLGPAVRHGHKHRGAGEPKGLGQSAGVRAGGVALIQFFARSNTSLQ